MKANTNYKIKNKKDLIKQEQEEDFNIENLLIKNKKNTSNNIINSSSNKLRDWLISCNLISYYNIFNNNLSFSIEKIIKSYKKNNKKLSYKDIENLGIRKPGHIFRFIIKLEIDSNTIDYEISTKIINRFNSNVLNSEELSASNHEIKCCGMTVAFGDKYNNNNINANYGDIFHFLNYLGLMKFKENFVHNGFDQVDYIILQLFSEYKFDKKILKEFLHIYDEKDRNYVLNVLYEERNKIAEELGIKIDENEKEKILNNNNLNEDFAFKECFIF